MALGLLATAAAHPAGAAPTPTTARTERRSLAAAFDRTGDLHQLLAPAPTGSTLGLDLETLLRPAAKATPQAPAAAVTPPAEAPAPPPAPTPGELAVWAALSRLGSPYVWGGSGPTSFDCSGLTMWAWGQVGVGLGHYTGSQHAQTQPISEAELQPGDLVFYWRGGRSGDPSHVGLYVGDGNIVHAPGRGRPVQIQSIWYWSGASVAFGRV